MKCFTAFLAVDSGFGERAIEQLAGRPDEWFAAAVFLVARLLAEEEEAGAFRSFAKNGLGRMPVKRAGGAMERGFAQCR